MLRDNNQIGIGIDALIECNPFAGVLFVVLHLPRVAFIKPFPYGKFIREIVALILMGDHDIKVR